MEERTLADLEAVASTARALVRLAQRGYFIGGSSQEVGALADELETMANFAAGTGPSEQASALLERARRACAKLRALGAPVVTQRARRSAHLGRRREVGA